MRCTRSEITGDGAMWTYRRADCVDGVQYWAVEGCGDVDYFTSARVAAAVCALRNAA